MLVVTFYLELIFYYVSFLFYYLYSGKICQKYEFIMTKAGGGKPFATYCGKVLYKKRAYNGCSLCARCGSDGFFPAVDRVKSEAHVLSLAFRATIPLRILHRVAVHTQISFNIQTTTLKKL